MQFLRRLVVALAIDLAVLFGIGRLPFDNGLHGLVDIEGFVYVLALIAVVTTILLAPAWRANPYSLLAMYLGFYLAGKLVLFSDPQYPLFGGYHTLGTIVEVGLLSATVVLSRAIARALHDLQTAVEHLTLPAWPPRIKPIEEASKDIQIALLKSRRYSIPLSVLVIEPGKAFEREVQEAMRQRHLLARMGQTILKALRRTDTVLVEPAMSRFIILCPDTDADKSRILARHAHDAIADALGMNVRCGAATFPNEGLTFQDLVEEAGRRFSDGHVHPRGHATAFSGARSNGELAVQEEKV